MPSNNNNGYLNKKNQTLPRNNMNTVTMATMRHGQFQDLRRSIPKPFANRFHGPRKPMVMPPPRYNCRRGVRIPKRVPTPRPHQMCVGVCPFDRRPQESNLAEQDHSEKKKNKRKLIPRETRELALKRINRIRLSEAKQRERMKKAMEEGTSMITKESKETKDVEKTSSVRVSL